MPPSEDRMAALHDQALEAMDRLLAKRPQKEDHAFSEATRCLCALRDELIRRQSGADASPEERGQLERLNAVISVVVGGHFPLESIPWDEIEKARSWIT